MAKRLPHDVPFHGPKERPLAPYFAFMVLEFWLVVGGITLLFWWPLWGAVALATALVLFIAAVHVGG